MIPAERLTANTRDILWKWQKENQKSNLNLPRDNCFTVERVNKTRKNKNQTQMLMKFSGYPADLECWEPVTNLPSFVVKHYSDKSKLGKSFTKSNCVPGENDEPRWVRGAELNTVPRPSGQ